MARKDYSASTLSYPARKDAGIVRAVTIGGDANAGVTIVGQNPNLLGERVAGARPEMTSGQGTEAVTQEDLATAVQAPLGRPLQQPPDSSEQRDSQSPVTRWVAMLVRWRP